MRHEHLVRLDEDYGIDGNTGVHVLRSIDCRVSIIRPQPFPRDGVLASGLYITSIEFDLMEQMYGADFRVVLSQEESSQYLALREAILNRVKEALRAKD